MNENRDKSVFLFSLKLLGTLKLIVQFPHRKAITNQLENQFHDEFPHSGDSRIRDIKNTPLICRDLGCQISPE